MFNRVLTASSVVRAWLSGGVTMLIRWLIALVLRFDLALVHHNATEAGFLASDRDCFFQFDDVAGLSAELLADPGLCVKESYQRHILLLRPYLAAVHDKGGLATRLVHSPMGSYTNGLTSRGWSRSRWLRC